MNQRGATGIARAPLRSRGLTLVEVMVALVVGLILSAGAIQIFISSKKTYQTTDAVSRIQENGRYALHFLSKDVRAAGFWGCAQDIEMTNHVDDSGGGLDLGGPPLIGTEGGADPDSLTIRSASQDRRRSVTQSMPNTSANLFLTLTDDINVGDVMIITDCEAADAFVVTNNNTNNDNLAHNTGSITNSTLENATKNFSRRYDESATAYAARQKTYEIGTTAEGEPALVRTVNGNSEVLVAGVQDMQLTYGVDTSNDETVDVYVQANNVSSWGDVLAVRVALLMRSRDANVVDTAQTYYFPGPSDAITATDRHLYQAFNATTTLRNRLP